ncbi:MAG: FtsB family cell division protein [Patescibacteria group bacterium]
MQKSKIKPRILVSADKTKSNSFLTNLFSNQRFLAIIGLVFLVLIIFPLARTYSQKRAVEKEINDVKKQISEFENTNQDLKEMINYLNSDQSLEEEARLNLNLKKSGEQVVVINDIGNKVTTSSLVAPAKNKSNLAKWRDYFFN